MLDKIIPFESELQYSWMRYQNHVAKYKVTEVTNDVVHLMSLGWKLRYNTGCYPPTAYLEKDGEFIDVANWQVTVLFGNKLVVCDNKFPISTYKLKTIVLMAQVAKNFNEFLRKKLDQLKRMKKAISKVKPKSK